MGQRPGINSTLQSLRWPMPFRLLGGQAFRVFLPLLLKPGVASQVQGFDGMGAVAGDHLGSLEAVEIDGSLFDADTADADADALAEASEGFREFALTQCDGVISHACLEEYARKEITQPTSPLSVLFASRVRGRRCGSGCGHIKKTSRLP